MATVIPQNFVKEAAPELLTKTIGDATKHMIEYLFLGGLGERGLSYGANYLNYELLVKKLSSTGKRPPKSATATAEVSPSKLRSPVTPSADLVRGLSYIIVEILNFTVAGEAAPGGYGALYLQMMSTIISEYSNLNNDKAHDLYSARKEFENICQKLSIIPDMDIVATFTKFLKLIITNMLPRTVNLDSTKQHKSTNINTDNVSNILTILLNTYRYHKSQDKTAEQIKAVENTIEMFISELNYEEAIVVDQTSTEGMSSYLASHGISRPEENPNGLSSWMADKGITVENAAQSITQATQILNDSLSGGVYDKI